MIPPRRPSLSIFHSSSSTSLRCSIEHCFMPCNGRKEVAYLQAVSTHIGYTTLYTPIIKLTRDIPLALVSHKTRLSTHGCHLERQISWQDEARTTRKSIFNDSSWPRTVSYSLFLTMQVGKLVTLACVEQLTVEPLQLWVWLQIPSPSHLPLPFFHSLRLPHYHPFLLPLSPLSSLPYVFVNVHVYACIYLYIYL